jgi:D-beta-D-heptose 7-phosphate kinase/D-beta-D-heptose 1-phosphate adenosyltransferase
VAVLQELRCVDEVIVFDDITPLNLITQIRPAVLVKGPDYSGRRVSGQDFVESTGGRVYVPDWHVDISTSWIIQRICDDYDSRRSHD